MKYFRKLVGKDVYLSPRSPEDAEQYTKWINDPAVSDGLGNTSHLISVEEEREYLARRDTGLQFAIVRREDDDLLGSCGIDSIQPVHQCASVGVFIGEEENRGRGYGGQALSLLLDYCFDTLNLHSVSLSVFSFNERAIACYRRLGFREAGRQRENYFIRGQFYDRIMMDILRDEWVSRRGKAEGRV